MKNCFKDWSQSIGWSDSKAQLGTQYMYMLMHVEYSTIVLMTSQSIQ